LPGIICFFLARRGREIGSVKKGVKREKARTFALGTLCFNQKTWRRMAENPAAHGEFLAPSKNLAAHGGKPGGAWRVRGASKSVRAEPLLREQEGWREIRIALRLSPFALLVLVGFRGSQACQSCSSTSFHAGGPRGKGVTF
jgi:hypothetical protein